MSSKIDVPPIICFVGWSGSGKTTYLEKLIPELTKSNLRIGTIKHHHKHFDIDTKGKDSWRHKKAGSISSMIASPTQISFVMDVDHDYDLDELATFFPNVDIILAEGYKKAKKPKIEIFRSAVNESPFCVGDDNLIALVSDDRESVLGIPQFRFDDIRELALYIIDHFNLITT